ncbi:restriction endonuclease subunit S [Microscilla marina]|uniref:Restriction endonuclease S subunits n=1 Tax=Microscilla marina ATCC 23134 TaxID=313606 RepID=A1ZQK0_MICM2|nr:restriction endonuclease subunit S [Microscilla marina]EAY27372.1 restriction endonuclease S subunits [Microscilla marina ATCC 23134]
MSKWRKLGDLVSYSGKGITPKYVDESSIIVLNQKCIRNHNIDYTLARYTDDTRSISQHKFLQTGDILVNSTGQGTAGRCAFVDKLPQDKKVITDSHILILRFQNHFEAKCLSYVIFSIEELVQTFMDGSTGQGELDKVRLFNLMTSLTENKLYQKQIAKVLSDLDAKIALNNQINAELEAMAKLIYDYWFVQFDFPDANGKPYKSSGGKMVYNEELKREVPEGWEVKKISSFAKTSSGGTPLRSKKEYYHNGNIPWINSGELNQPFIVSSQKFITKEGLNNSSAKVFKKGTILIAMYGATAGKVSFMDIEACTNQAICAIDTHSNLRVYLKLGLETLYDYLVTLSSGSARDNLSQDKIKELKFVIPNEKLLQQFDKFTKAPLNNILANLKQNQQLTSLRDWLLPMLMNGQVSVAAAEAMVNK